MMDDEAIRKIRHFFDLSKRIRRVKIITKNVLPERSTFLIDSISDRRGARRPGDVGLAPTGVERRPNPHVTHLENPYRKEVSEHPHLQLNHLLNQTQFPIL